MRQIKRFVYLTNQILKTMPTYYLTCNWDMFYTVVRGIKPTVDEKDFCFLHHGEEVYIRTSDQELLRLIQKNFRTVLCDYPDSFYSEKSAWELTGNAYFFPPYLK